MKDKFTKQKEVDEPKAKETDPEEEDEFKDYNAKKGILIILKRSTLPILSSIFHPTYMMINAIILG